MWRIRKLFAREARFTLELSPNGVPRRRRFWRNIRIPRVDIDWREAWDLISDPLANLFIATIIAVTVGFFVFITLNIIESNRLRRENPVYMEWNSMQTWQIAATQDAKINLILTMMPRQQDK